MVGRKYHLIFTLSIFFDIHMFCNYTSSTNSIFTVHPTDVIFSLSVLGASMYQLEIYANSLSRNGE